MGTSKQSKKPEPVNRTALRRIEQQGMALRKQTGVGPMERLDPFAVKDELGVVVAGPEDFNLLGLDDLEHLRGVSARTWSGGAVPLPDGRLLVVLNPNQTRERAVVTLMEEVAHVFLGHQPSLVGLDRSAPIGRRYDAEVESEAYWTAAAALVPSRVIAHAVWARVPGETLAANYGVSVELVEFRIKTWGLWHLYRNPSVAA